MKKKFLKFGMYALLAPWLLVGVAVTAFLHAENTSAQNGTPEVRTVSQTEVTTHIYFFGREGCHFCEQEKAFLDKVLASHPEVSLVHYDIIKDDVAKELFAKITEANNLARVTPLTLVGGKVIQGYGGDEITGLLIMKGITEGKDPDIATYLEKGDVLKSGEGCDEHGTSSTCDVGLTDTSEFLVKLPFVGVVDVTVFSLFTLSSVLGTIDGFNPCALWVLMTFLFVLMQIGSRKRLVYVAGIFLAAEAIMYYLILTAWYKTWNFVGLDQIVTPLIGVLGLGSGMFFLYRWYKTRNKFTCDITSVEQQATITKKINALAHSPITILSIAGIIGIAFSVNIIEFACSIGIPQVFTKVLELNSLSFWSHQWYLLVYIVGYMVDDIVVFSFAIYGINKMNASEKYSKLSMLVGGLLMMALGILMLVFPDVLVF